MDRKTLVLPDSDTRVIGHTTGHSGFRAFDDTLVLRRIGYACSSWKQSDHNTVHTCIYPVVV